MIKIPEKSGVFVNLGVDKLYTMVYNIDSQGEHPRKQEENEL